MKEDPKAEALRWLKQAEAEIKDAGFLAKSRRYYLALFLCQQAADKALKAFLYYKELEPVFTHSVSKLLDMAADIDKDFCTVEECKRLDDYYIPTRYPNGLPGDIPSTYYDDPKEARRMLRNGKKIIKLVTSKLDYT